jgi:uncharacterized protein YkwD
MPLVLVRERSSGFLCCFTVALVVVIALLMRIAPAAGASDPEEARASGAHCNQHNPHLGARRFARAVRCVQNRYRRAHGLPSLRGSRSLRRAASRHARDMARRKYFSHVSFGGRTVMHRVRRSGYGRRFAAGENIYYALPPRPTPAKVVAAWMASSGHRQQILSGRWRDTGIGIVMRAPVRAPGGVTAVAVFGRR